MAQVPRQMEVMQADGSFALRPPSYIDNLALVANTEKVYTIPALCRYIVFSCTDNFYVNYRGASASSPYDTRATAAVPAADSITGIGPELNPTVRFIGGNGTASEIVNLRIVAPVGCILTIGVYQ